MNDEILEALTAISSRLDAIEKKLEILVDIEPALREVVDRVPSIMAQFDEVMPKISPMVDKFQSSPISKILGIGR